MTGLGSVDEPLNLTGERLSLTPRTDDPADPVEGQAWIREDKNIGDWIAIFRYYDGDTTQEIPILPVTDDFGTKSVRALEINGEDGYIPIEDRDNADHPKWSVQTDVGWLGFTGTGIPDSVVSRDPDNSTETTDLKLGLQIETSVNWIDIGAELSSEYGGEATTAEIWRTSDETLMGDTDISGLDAGDTFVVEDVQLKSGEAYNFVIFNDGGDYTRGFDDGASFPYTSDDGDIEIVSGGAGESGSGTYPYNLLRVGNVGFD